LDLALGVDLGTSGLRLALLNGQGELVAERQAAYPGAFGAAASWRDSLIALVASLEPGLRRRIGAIALDGTSGTLLRCEPDGNPLGDALAYHQAFPRQQSACAALVAPGSPAASASGSLARALVLRQGAVGPGLLRHQADWLMGWLLGDWRWGEEGNNLKLGWDLSEGRWSGTLGSQAWASELPEVVASGTRLGALGAGARALLDLEPGCLVVAGTTDANAAVLAAAPQLGEGITVLGTTLVLKQFSPVPISGPGISCHRLGGRWLVGGASNAGGGVLRQFFSGQDLVELSRQINPDQPSGLQLRPLPRPGERFPVDDPGLEPVLGPRPVSDALFLQGLLEGLAAIERAGWQRLLELGAPPIGRVISLGGGARNPQWRRIREQCLGLPVWNRPNLSAAAGVARLALGALEQEPGARMGTDPLALATPTP
jgi:sugar (pentulose or hexulose) kinase